MSKKLIVLLLSILSLLFLANCSTDTEPVLNIDDTQINPEVSEIFETLETDAQNKPETASQVAFIVMHMDPGNANAPLERAETYWPDLVDFVDMANSYDVHLTLEFTPQWAEYILQEKPRLNLLRAWEEEGHEIGYHGHGPHHQGTWDGYTDQEEFIDDIKYRGSMSDGFALVSQLPATGQILTGGIGGEGDAELDWPEGLIYATNGGSGYDDLISSPTKAVYHDGLEVLELTYQIFVPNSPIAASLVDITKALDKMTEYEALGLIFHAKNTHGNFDYYEELFKHLSENNVTVLSVDEIHAL